MPDMRPPHLHPLRWLGQRDRGFAALRRATRTAIIMPAMFALGDKVIGDPQLATFAAFGSFAMLLLVDFGGPMAERLQAEAALAVNRRGVRLPGHAGLADRVARGRCDGGVVAFGVIFAGVVSSVLAGATTALLLAFILPVSLAAPPSAVPDRLAGWAMAGGVALVATAFLWPAPARDRLRGAAAAACRRCRPGCVRGSRTCSAAWTNNLRWIAITRLRRRTRRSRRCAVPSWRRPTGQPD